MPVDIEKDIEEVEEELKHEKEKVKSTLWKYGRLIATIILIILMISYIIVTPNVREVIAGIIESSVVKNDNFVHNNKTIIFEHNTFVELKRLFRENQKTEFRVCLKGLIEDNNYLIHDILRPNVHSATVFQVISEPCSSRTIIDLHSHPYQKCVASQTDLLLLEKEKRHNPDILMAVMCTDRRISFYG